MLTQDLTPEQRRERCATCGLPRVAHPDDAFSEAARRAGRACNGFVVTPPPPPPKRK